MPVDYFLKVEGVDGESKDSQYGGWIDVVSWAWSETQTGTLAHGGGGGGGKVSMKDFVVRFHHCKASPKLMEGCASGQRFGSATLVARVAGGTQAKFLQIKFTDVLVGSYETSGASGSAGRPIDNVGLNFGKIEHEYQEQTESGSPGGTVLGNWNLKLNKKG